MDTFQNYLLTIHKDDILRIIQAEDIYKSYSINIDFLKLFEEDPVLGDGILCNPNNVLPKCSQTIVDAQKEVLNDETSRLEAETFCRRTLKNNVHARFFGLPACPELNRNAVPKNKDLNCFLRITGTATRITQAKMLEYRRSYKCTTCGHTQLVEGKYQNRYVITAPSACGSPVQCRGRTLVQVHNVARDNCKDYQEMKIQEQVNKLTLGGIPGSIWVTLEDDLVDFCKPGDDVSICGVVLRRWRPLSSNKKCDVELVFKANHIQVCNTQKSHIVTVDPNVKVDFDEFWDKYRDLPMSGREIILASICPKIYGLYMVKLALLLTVITGCSHSLDMDQILLNKTISPKNEANSHDVRGQCHLLLVGDPGTGKSQLLKAATTLTSRSVLTSGSGSTKAGLTCTALREEGEWQLEAGALVLADGGVCCIDELAQMREHDRASIHEAMEQQTISVAKAGMICKLNTRCAVVAACNPKGNYDTDQPLNVNVSLGTPLLSRFDLIFILLDTKNKDWDNLVADYILFKKNSQVTFSDIWSVEKLQTYLSFIGPYAVSMTPAATNILQAYYVSQRKSENRDPSRTTVRMLDSLVRLSQAHAKLMHRKKVYPVDAITAVCLMDLSMQDCILTGSSDALQTNFSKYPDFEYLKTAKLILSNLNLDEIWQEELLNYARILKVERKKLEYDIDHGNYSAFAKIDIPNMMGDDKVDVIESTYFKHDSPKKMVVQNTEINKSRLFHDDSESDIDEILQFDVSAKRKTLISEPSTSKLTTADMLAKSLKKHSVLNRNQKIHVGLISERQKKKVVRKKGNNKTEEKKVVPVSKRKRENKQIVTTKRRNKKTKSEDVQKDLSLSSNDDDDDVNANEDQLLKCLPSVNDVFDGLKINFTMSEDEDSIADSIPSKSPENNLSGKENEKPDTNSKMNSVDVSISKNKSSDNIKPKSSNRNTINLDQFKFVDRKLNTSNESDTSCNNTSKNDVTDSEQSTVSNKNLKTDNQTKENNVVVENSSEFPRNIQFTSTQKSIFDSEDFDSFEL